MAAICRASATAFTNLFDPRAPRLLALVDEAASQGVVSGAVARIARAIEEHLATERGKPVPMNIDGATAVIYAELGCPPPLARGFFRIVTQRRDSGPCVGADRTRWAQQRTNPTNLSLDL